MVTELSAIASSSDAWVRGVLAVDFVRQQYLGEDRSGSKFELGGLGIENRRTGDIVGKQVRCALHAVEAATDAGRQSTGENGLGNAGDIFQQDVSFGKIGDQGNHDFLPLADDDLLDIVDDPLGDRGDDAHSGDVFLLPAMFSVPSFMTEWSTNVISRVAELLQECPF